MISYLNTINYFIEENQSYILASPEINCTFLSKVIQKLVSGTIYFFDTKINTIRMIEKCK